MCVTELNVLINVKDHPEVKNTFINMCLPKFNFII